MIKKITVLFSFVCLLCHTIAQAGNLDDLIQPVERNVVFYAAEPVEVAVANPTGVVVSGGATFPVFTLSVAQMLADIQAALVERYSLDGELEVYTTTALNDVEITGMDYELVFVNLPARKLQSTARVHFKIMSNGKKVAEYRLNLRLEYWMTAYVAKRNFRPGEFLSANDFEVKDVDALQFRYPIVTSDVSLMQYEAASRIVAGKPLYKKDLGLKPFVHQGDLVDVIAVEGALSISLKAIALEDGNIGSLIRLRNPRSRKEFQAHITHEKTLRVFF